MNGVNTAFAYPTVNNPTVVVPTITKATPQYQNTAPEFALVYRPDNEWQWRARVATGYGTPQIGNLFMLPSGLPGNNTSLQTQTNLGYDVGADWTPNKALKLSATAFYEFFNNELVTQATPTAGVTYTFNAPHSEHHGVKLAAQWGFYEGWQLTAAYTYLDEVYTNYFESISGFTFNRDGNKIPGISPNELTARLGYDQLHGPLTGLGGFVEVVWKDSFYMDNADLLKAPGYELVNVNLHYKTDLTSDYFRQLTMFFEVRNIFNTTYVASANNIANTVTSAGIQNPGSVLAATQTGSIYAGSLPCFRCWNEGCLPMIEELTMKHRTFIVTLALALTQGSAGGQMSHNHASEAACETTELLCASKVTPAFGADGTLWLAWMAGGQVLVASSGDGGHTLSPAVQVTQGKPNLDWGPDARPKIVVDRKGGIAVAFSTFRDKAFNGEVFYSRSTDGGGTFAPPRPITDNAESQRFEALGFDPEGNLFAAWLDKRNRVPVQQAGKKYDGAALFFASSKDGGATYSQARMAADSTWRVLSARSRLRSLGSSGDRLPEHFRWRHQRSCRRHLYRPENSGRSPSGEPR